MLSITATILALWKGTVFMGKIVAGITGAYVAYKVFEAAADWVNRQLDEYFPDLLFRLTAHMVEWGTLLVKSVLSVALAKDNFGQLLKELKELTVHAFIQLLADIIGERIDEYFGREGTRTECEILAHGVHYALAHA